VPDGILKSSLSPFRKYQNIYYTPPCHVSARLICITNTSNVKFICNIKDEYSNVNYVYQNYINNIEHQQVKYAHVILKKFTNTFRIGVEI